MSISLREASLSITPTGCIIAFAGSSAPTGWRVCDGTQLGVGDFADLYNVIGTTYNVSTTATGYFSIPDLRGRVIAGMGGTLLSASADAIGATNAHATKTHTLSIAEMPAHTHSLQNGVGVKTNSFDSGTDVASDASGNTGLTGNGLAHNNVQPTIILNYIIKI
tara:strand:- start:2131 stop:2622 length:492 start_codon:yes stop_codon:yes gene_type:complete